MHACHRHLFMLIAIPALLALTIGSHAAEVTSPPSAPATDAKPAPAAIDSASRFKVSLQNLSINRNANFQDGDPNNLSVDASANLGMRITWQRSVICVGQADNIVWQEITTSAGENLLPPANQDRSNNRNNNDSNRREMWINGQFSAPTKPAAFITRMRGTIPVRCESAAAKPLNLSPIKDWIGNSRKIPGTDYLITLVSCADQKLTYRYPRDAEALMRGVQVVDSDGTVIESHGRSGSGNGKTQTYELRFEEDIPLDGTFRIRLVGETTVVQVPFDFTNIPLSETASVETITPKP